ncbi:MAG: NAD(P)H-quinone oxidoreductase subunit 4 [Pseudanabaenaceae cyanobacterium]
MSTAPFPWLTAIILLPMAAAAMIPFLPDKDGKQVRWAALAVALADLVLAVWGIAGNYDATQPTFQMVERLPWVPQIGLEWSLAVDGVSMPLILLAGVVTTLAILASWSVQVKPRLFFALLLVLYGAQIGVFAAKDALLFFLMWELELVPVYLLIAIWGGPKRRYAATKFILYTAIASIFILVGVLALAFTGTPSFDMAALASKSYPLALEVLVYGALAIAFGTKLSVFPLHTWLPDAHGEASAPVSMILAGVLLKMGAYGLIRFNLEMLPHAHIVFAPLLAILGVVNIVYGALDSLAQTNMKRRLAYSSISHMGFVLVGLASFTDVGLGGAMLQLISHGAIAAALFFLAGIAYDRTHTLNLGEMGGLARAMPTVFALFTAGSMASLALPGTSGFASEISVFLGTATSTTYSEPFKAMLVLLAAVGVILTPIYLLSMLRQAFYGKTGPALPNLLTQAFSDAKPRETFIAVCLLAPAIAVGFYPNLLAGVYDAKLTAVSASVQQTYRQVAAAGNLPKVAGLKLPLVTTKATFPVGTLAR